MDEEEIFQQLAELSIHSSSCTACTVLQLPILSEHCLKYGSLSSTEDVVSFLSRAIKNKSVSQQRTLKNVINTIAPLIVDFKHLTDNMVFNRNGLLYAWTSVYRMYPSGNGKPVDRVVDFIADNWSVPKTNFMEMMTTTRLSSLLNMTPQRGEKIITPLKKYLHSRGVLSLSFHSLCSYYFCTAK